MKIINGKETIKKEKSDLLYDESRFSLGVPERVYYPENETDVLKVLREASTENIPVTIIGAQTGITGGSVPVDGCYALCMSQMNKIRSITEIDGTTVLSCDPGISLENIGLFLENPGTWPYPVTGAADIAPSSLFYPPDPTEMTAHLGGTVATNASGARSFRFGPTRDHVDYLRLAFVSGDTLTLRRGDVHEQDGFFSFVTDQGSALTVPAPDYFFPDVKNASGYFSRPGMDALDLFIGSEGTLAVILEIGIILRKSPPFISGLTFFAARTQAFSFADFLRGVSRVAAIEFFDQSALLLLSENRDRLPVELPEFPLGKSNAVYWEFSDSFSDRAPDRFESVVDTWESQLVSYGSSFDDTWSGFEHSEAERLKSFRHTVPELVNSVIAAYKSKCPEVRKIGTDAALPGDCFQELFSLWVARIEETGIRYAAFGHLGDFHVHINMLPKTREELDVSLRLYRSMMEQAVKAGGSVSAEHGIGKIKRDYLAMMYGAEAIMRMREIKRSLDNNNLLNPGNLF